LEADHRSSTDISLQPSIQLFNWVKVSNEDGYHAITTSNGSLILENIASRRRKVILEAQQAPPVGASFVMNLDQTKILWAANITKGYRYSFFANYLVQDVASGKVEPLDAAQNKDVQYAVWSPK
jgi:dipeptidyl-peptidase 4